MHLTASPIDWYVARAGGIVAYLLLTGAVFVGIALASKKQAKLPRFAVEDVHRFFGLAAGSFLIVHIGAVAIDSYVPFSLVQLTIPGASSFRPVWVAVGIVAAELMLALAVTNLLQKRMPYRLWRRLHYLSFLVWVGALVHALGAGTDRNAVWLLWLYAASLALVVGALVWRILRRQARLAWAAGVVCAAVALLLPFALPVPATSSRKVTPEPLPRSFADTFTAQLLEQKGYSNGIVSVSGTGNGRAHVAVRADLLVSAEQAQPVGTSFQLEYLPSGRRCNGKIAKIYQLGFDATCTDANGSHAVIARWQQEGNRLAGTLTLQAPARSSRKQAAA